MCGCGIKLREYIQYENKEYGERNLDTKVLVNKRLNEINIPRSTEATYPP